MIDMNPLRAWFNRLTTRFFVTPSPSIDTGQLEEARRKQYRENKRRDAERQEALYGTLIFYCPKGHPYELRMIDDKPQYICTLCVAPPPPVPPVEPQPPNPYKQYHLQLEQQRQRQQALNAKFNRGIAPDMSTQMISDKVPAVKRSAFDQLIHQLADETVPRAKKVG